MFTSPTSPTNLISSRIKWGGVNHQKSAAQLCCSAAMCFIRCCWIQQTYFCKTEAMPVRAAVIADLVSPQYFESDAQVTTSYTLAYAKGNTVDCTSKRSWLWYPGLCLLRVWTWSTHTNFWVSAQQLVCADLLHSQCSVWWVWNLTPVRAQDSVTSKLNVLVHLCHVGAYATLTMCRHIDVYHDANMCIYEIHVYHAHMSWCVCTCIKIHVYTHAYV